MFRIIGCVLLIGALALSTTAQAVPNYQDMWWQPTESGWGLNVLHQGGTISAVLFHYRADRKPVWYLLSNATAAPAGEIYTGTLFETTGSPLFGPFVPSSGTTRAVGTMTLRFDALNSAQVDYSIDGQTTSKAIERITFQALDVNGSYTGAQTAVASCTNPATQGNYVIPAQFTVTARRLGRVSLTTSLLNTGPVVCDYTGEFPQSGSVITGSGGFSCRAASNAAITQLGDFQVEQMRVMDHAVVINFRSTSTFPTNGSSCVERGVISGTRLQNAN